MNCLARAALVALLLASIAAALYFGIGYIRLSRIRKMPPPERTISDSLPVAESQTGESAMDTEDSAALMQSFFEEQQARQPDLEIIDEALRQDLANRRKKERFLAQFEPNGMPVGADHYISQRFGPEHPAMDFAAPMGADVFAVASGVVRYCYSDRYLGSVLVVDHLNGYASLYAHLSEHLYDIGRFVEKGEVIARVGNSGNSTAPHLHLELWREGVRMDPALLLPLEENKPQQ